MTRYTVDYYARGRWNSIGRTFWTRRGAVRMSALIKINVQTCGTRIRVIRRRRKGRAAPD